MYRNTYAIINLKNLKYNIKKIKKNYPNYKYYIGVVKADCYGHNGNLVIESIIESGCNYLAVSSLDEALEIRKKFDIHIMCLGIINEKYIKICEKNNIDITITNLKYYNKVKNYKVNIQLKIDTGMNRLGIKSKKELEKIIELSKTSKAKIKGIYTHIYDYKNKNNTLIQINKFKEMIKGIDLKNIEMIHISQSDTLLNYPKIDICNACRLGIAMYGLTNNKIGLKNTFSLISEIIEIKNLKRGETVGYNGIYTASKNEFIGIASIGYADGLNRKITGASIYINNKKYEIIGNICMDMIMIKIDKTIKVHDKVYIFKDNNHILKLSNYLNTIPYELICNISKRVPRIYK